MVLILDSNSETDEHVISNLLKAFDYFESSHKLNYFIQKNCMCAQHVLIYHRKYHAPTSEASIDEVSDFLVVKLLDHTLYLTIKHNL